MSLKTLIETLNPLVTLDDEEVHSKIAREILLEMVVVAFLVTAYGFVWPEAVHFLHLREPVQKTVFAAHEAAILAYSLHAALKIIHTIIARWKT